MTFINWSLLKLFNWMAKFDTLWVLFVLILCFGAIWKLFMIIPAFLVVTGATLSPTKWINAFTISLLAILNSGYLSYKIWTQKEDYNGWEIFMAILISLIIFDLTYTLVKTSIVLARQEDY